VIELDFFHDDCSPLEFDLLFFLTNFFIVTKLVARKTDDSALSEIVGFVFNTQQ
jgi:hypothetical protein